MRKIISNDEKTSRVNYTLSEIIVGSLEANGSVTSARVDPTQMRMYHISGVRPKRVYKGLLSVGRGGKAGGRQTTNVNM